MSPFTDFVLLHVSLVFAICVVGGFISGVVAIEYFTARDRMGSKWVGAMWVTALLACIAFGCLYCIMLTEKGFGVFGFWLTDASAILLSSAGLGALTVKVAQSAVRRRIEELE